MTTKKLLLNLDPRVIYEILQAFQIPRTESEARAHGLKKGKNNETMSQYTGQLHIQGLIAYSGVSDRARRKSRLTPRKLRPPFDKIDSYSKIVFSSDPHIKTPRDLFDSIFHTPTPRYLITEKGKRFLKAFEEFQGLFDILAYVPDQSPTEQELREDKIFAEIATKLGLKTQGKNDRKAQNFEY